MRAEVGLGLRAPYAIERVEDDGSPLFVVTPLRPVPLPIRSQHRFWAANKHARDWSARVAEFGR